MDPPKQGHWALFNNISISYHRLLLNSLSETERERDDPFYCLKENIWGVLGRIFSPCVLFFTKFMRLGEEFLLAFMFDEENNASKISFSISQMLPGAGIRLFPLKAWR